jgi:hypothetical protein
MAGDLSWALKGQEDEVELFSPLSSAQIIYAWSFNFTVSVCFHDMKLCNETSNHAKRHFKLESYIIMIFLLRVVSCT